MAGNADDGTNKPGKGKDFADSLNQLKEALKDASDVSAEEGDRDDSIMSSYAKTHADSNVELARRNLAQDPENPMLRDWLAFNLYASGRYEEAAMIYEACLRDSESNPDQHYYLGNCYFKRGDLKRAIASWEKVSQLDPTCKCAQKAQSKLEKVRAKQPQA